MVAAVVNLQGRVEGSQLHVLDHNARSDQQIHCAWPLHICIATYNAQSGSVY